MDLILVLERNATGDTTRSMRLSERLAASTINRLEPSLGSPADT